MTAGRDLSSEAFVALRRSLFDADGEPVPFTLRDKRNTQDDPLDEHLQQLLGEHLDDGDLRAQRSSGPLISPDMAVVEGATVRARMARSEALRRSEVVGIEVKKLERTKSGKVARATGLDYNTTPPSETLDVRGPNDELLEIPGSYLFTVLERSGDEVELTSLVMCDGALLNDDVDLYKSIVGERTKVIGLGSYGDGVDRQRPMLIFSNPLSVSELDSAPTLVSARADLADEYEELCLAGMIERTRSDGEKAVFYCYRVAEDCDGSPLFTLVDPFPSPVRTEQTHARGRFRLDL